MSAEHRTQNNLHHSGYVLSLSFSLCLCMCLCLCLFLSLAWSRDNGGARGRHGIPTPMHWSRTGLYRHVGVHRDIY